MKGSQARILFRRIVPRGIRRGLRRQVRTFARAWRRYAGRIRRSQEMRKLSNIRRHRAWRRPRLAIKYFLFNHEVDNYTYELENEAELAVVVGKALGVPATVIAGYVDELQADDALRKEINRRLVGLGRNRTMPYGRRLGWYAVVRHVKPAVVVETGIHDGLGSTVLLRALDRNGSGRLLSFDIREGVGSLVPDDLRSRWTPVIGDALAAIPQIEEPVDLFMHDSDHRYAYEMAELTAIAEVAAPGIVYMTDNARATTAFRDFCLDRGLTPYVFSEVPRDHFYPGDGMGLAVANPPGVDGGTT